MLLSGNDFGSCGRLAVGRKPNLPTERGSPSKRSPALSVALVARLGKRCCGLRMGSRRNWTTFAANYLLPPRRLNGRRGRGNEMSGERCPKCGDPVTRDLFNGSFRCQHCNIAIARRLDTSDDDEPRSPWISDYSRPEAFVWWQQQFPGRRFPVECPECATEVQFKQRVTLRARACPGCGYILGTDVIDAQLDAWERERRRLMRPAPSGCCVFLLAVAGVGAALLLG
jgi:ribosomal protein L37AE/L43A